MKLRLYVARPFATKVPKNCGMTKADLKRLSSAGGVFLDVVAEAIVVGDTKAEARAKTMVRKIEDFVKFCREKRK